jgi:hypothetical protein
MFQNLSSRLQTKEKSCSIPLNPFLILHVVDKGPDSWFERSSQDREWLPLQVFDVFGDSGLRNE